MSIGLSASMSSRCCHGRRPYLAQRFRVVIAGSVITTYNLGDAQSHQSLAADLRSRGFDVEVDETPGDHARLTVTHEADKAGRLDECIYAAAPLADIVETIRSNNPAHSNPSDTQAGPHHRSGSR